MANNCMWCGKEPEGTIKGNECDACWELRTRMESMKKSMVLKILATVCAEEEAKHE